MFGHFVIIRFLLKELANLKNCLGFAKSLGNFCKFQSMTALFTLETHNNPEGKKICNICIQMMQEGSPMNKQVDLCLVRPVLGCIKERKIQVLKALIHEQQAELSETTHTVTVFPVLCFLCLAAVPLLSMSQISNDRRVCASCTKSACL